MSQGYTRGYAVDTDTSLVSNSDYLVASQKALKYYVDNKTGSQGYQGNQGAQGNQGYQGYIGSAYSENIITPSQLTSTQNDYNPSGFSTATILRVSSDNGLRGINGFLAGSNGDRKTLVNIGTYPIYLAPYHTGSSSNNRIVFHRDFILFPNSSVDILYDTVLNKWLIIGVEKENCRSFYNELYVGSATAADIGNFTFVNGGQTITATGANGSMPAIYNLTSSITSSNQVSGFSLNKSNGNVVGQNYHIISNYIFSLPSLLDSSHTLETSIGTQMSTTAAPTSRYGVYYNGSNHSFFSVSNNTTNGTGQAISANTLYNICICLNKENSECRVYLNGDLLSVQTGTPLAAGAITSQAFIRKQSGGSSRTVYLNYMDVKYIY